MRRRPSARPSNWTRSLQTTGITLAIFLQRHLNELRMRRWPTVRRSNWNRSHPPSGITLAVFSRRHPNELRKQRRPTARQLNWIRSLPDAGTTLAIFSRRYPNAMRRRKRPTAKRSNWTRTGPGSGIVLPIFLRMYPNELRRLRRPTARQSSLTRKTRRIGVAWAFFWRVRLAGRRTRKLPSVMQCGSDQTISVTFGTWACCSTANWPSQKRRRSIWVGPISLIRETQSQQRFWRQPYESQRLHASNYPSLLRQLAELISGMNFSIYARTTHLLERSSSASAIWFRSVTPLTTSSSCTGLSRSPSSTTSLALPWRWKTP